MAACLSFPLSNFSFPHVCLVAPRGALSSTPATRSTAPNPTHLRRATASLNPPRRQAAPPPLTAQPSIPCSALSSAERPNHQTSIFYRVRVHWHPNIQLHLIPWVYSWVCPCGHRRHNKHLFLLVFLQIYVWIILLLIYDELFPRCFPLSPSSMIHVFSLFVVPSLTCSLTFTLSPTHLEVAGQRSRSPRSLVKHLWP